MNRDSVVSSSLAELKMIQKTLNLKINHQIIFDTVVS